MVQCIEAPPQSIRPEMRTYNIQAMSFTPAELVTELRNYFPDLVVDYQPDDRQIIGEYVQSTHAKLACILYKRPLQIKACS